MALLAGLVACSDRPRDEPEPLVGAELVAGTSLVRHGLVVIPRGGGPAQLRPLEDPSTVRRTGRAALPASTAAHGIGRSIVLRHEGGASLYVPWPEALTPLPDPPAGGRWIESGQGGAFVSGDRALLVTGSGTREVRSGGELLWAAPAEGGYAVGLVATAAGTELVLWEPGADEPSVARPVASRGPAVLAAWGREVVLSVEEGSKLVGWTLPGLESVEELSLDDAPAVLATSPSQHRIFAAPAERARLQTIDRYEWRTLASARVERPLRAVRVGVTGDHVLAWDGTDVWSVRTGDDRAVAIPTGWRRDLPLALPGGRILGVAAGSVKLFAADGTELGVVDGPLDAWWIPVRWGPLVPVAAAAPGEEEIEEDPEVPGTVGRTVGLLTMGRVSGEVVAGLPPGPRPDAMGERAGDAASAPVEETASVPSGFYAVATSSRRLESLRELRRALEGSGYATQVLPRRDEANDIWYRLMVGPYPSRAAAESVARELRRERGIDAWIREVEPSPGGPRP